MKVEPPDPKPPDPKHPDMSPAAIEERLRMVESLRRLGVSLKAAGERGPISVVKKTAEGKPPGIDDHQGADR